MIVLVIGGTRSGKSEVAERVAARLGEPVTVIAPAVATDAEFAARIAAHRARRPQSWSTVECGADVVTAVEKADGTILLDSLGTWIGVSDGFAIDGQALVTALRARSGSSVICTEEVGLAVHAPSEAGRRFTDAVGAVNELVAAASDRAVMVVAGRMVALEDPDDAIGHL